LIGALLIVLNRPAVHLPGVLLWKSWMMRMLRSEWQTIVTTHAHHPPLEH
jgi:hypothetical protein